jgi:hypothetical protein
VLLAGIPTTAIDSGVDCGTRQMERGDQCMTYTDEGGFERGSYEEQRARDDRIDLTFRWVELALGAVLLLSHRQQAQLGTQVSPTTTAVGSWLTGSHLVSSCGASELERVRRVHAELARRPSAAR